MSFYPIEQCRCFRSGDLIIFTVFLALIQKFIISVSEEINLKGNRCTLQLSLLGKELRMELPLI